MTSRKKTTPQKKVKRTYKKKLKQTALKPTDGTLYVDNLKNKIRHHIAEKDPEGAREALLKLRKVASSDPELYAFYAGVLLLENKPSATEKVVLEGIRRNGEDFTLLYYLGRVEEQRGQMINAFDIYRRAEQYAETDKRLKLIQRAGLRTRSRISGEKVFHKDTYWITLRGNRHPVELVYYLPRMMQRKYLLDSIKEHIDTSASEVMELECVEGVVARNLSDHGYRVRAVAPDQLTALKGIGLEFTEKFRLDILPSTFYSHLELDESVSGQLQESDVTLFLPETLEWYWKQGWESSVEIMKNLAEKARRQFFFYLPRPNSPEDYPTAGEELLVGELRRFTYSRDYPQLCMDDEGSRLYRVDRVPNILTGKERLVASGEEALTFRTKVFEVEISRCRDFNGFNFGPWGYNHFVALLRELHANPDQDYAGSVLQRFYDGFHPNNVKELWFPGDSSILAPLSRGWVHWPWQAGSQFFNREGATYGPRGNPLFGPNTYEFGAHEFKKCRRTFNLIQEYGYVPEIFPDSYVLGYFLKRGDDYRFIVTEGHHRMAALSFLGYETVECKHNPTYPRVVDIEDIDQWPQIEKDFYPKDVAAKVFRHYFKENFGVEIWQRVERMHE